MKFQFKGHHYQTKFLFAIQTRFSKWFGNYKNPVTMWFAHDLDCCDYWIPIDDPRAQRAFMLDDELALTGRSPLKATPPSKLRGANQPTPEVEE